MRDSECSPDDNQVTPIEHKNDTTKKPTPLPHAQLFIIYIIQFTEPVTATVIYPFINQFVRETGITGGDETKTGYFAGVIESAFFFAEAMTVVGWGMASDRFGRRPVLLWGPLGLSLVMLGFGMATRFWPLVIFRCLQGAFNGNIGVSKAVIGELTDSTNIADAFAIMPFMWSLGEIVGPLLGGLLSRPADRWPDTLGRLAYLRSHPYYLPCLAASMIAFTSFLCGLVALKETSPLIKKRRQAKRIRSAPESPGPTSSTSLLTSDCVADYGSGERFRRDETSSQDFESCLGQEDSEDLTPPTTRELLTPEVVIVLINYGFFLYVCMAVDVLIPLTWSTSIEHGGLGFTPYKIGLTLGTYGVINALVQLNLLGPALKRFGPQRVYCASAISLLLSFGAFPLEVFLAKRAGAADWRVWCIVTLQLASGMLNYAAYGAVQVIIQGVSPSRSALGVMNGLAQAVSAVTRAFAPAMVSSLHAISLQRNLAGGKAVYYIMLAIAVCAIPLPFLLPKKLHLD